MQVIERILSIFKPLRLILLALLIGIIFSVILSIFSYNQGDSDFSEIKNIPRNKEKNINNAEVYSDLKNIYDFNSQSVGIDVSTWQGAINFGLVKESGVDFVMIRCGFRKSHKEIVMDDHFIQNIESAINHGLNVGVYFYSTASTEIEALEEAKWVVDVIKDYKITYPVVYDMENLLELSTAHLTLEQINKNAKIFLDYIDNSGYVASLYSNGYDLNNRWDIDYLGKYMVWYAHYTDEPDYEGNYVMWQYSNKGKIKGISGNVDLNIAYFTYIGD